MARASIGRMALVVRGQSPSARVAALQQASAAVVADLFGLWQQTCGASRANQNSLKRPLCGLAPCPSSNESSPMIASSSSLTPSNAPSGEEQKEQPVRGQPRRRTNLGNHHNTAEDGENETTSTRSLVALTLQRIASGWLSSEIGACHGTTSA